MRRLWLRLNMNLYRIIGFVLLSLFAIMVVAIGSRLLQPANRAGVRGPDQPPVASRAPESSETGPTFFKSFADIERSTFSAQPEINVPELELQIHELINEQRAKFGLDPLKNDGEIEEIARGHSRDMAANDYFDHVNPQDQNSSDRGSAVGYDCVKVYSDHTTFGLAENIYQNWLYSSVTIINGVSNNNWTSQEEIAATTVDGWMNSEGHRKNILTETYDRAGIAVVIAPNDKVYITQNFC